MTEKQFWMKLDQIAGNSDKITEFIRILRQGYDEDLTLLIACHHIRPGEVGQMYVNLDERTPGGKTTGTFCATQAGNWRTGIPHGVSPGKKFSCGRSLTMR